MSIKMKITAVSVSGNTYEGRVTFADLQKADHSAYLTLEQKDGTLTSLNTDRMEVIHNETTREGFEKAREEFEKEIAELQAKKKSWDEAEAESKRIKEEKELEDEEAEAKAVAEAQEKLDAAEEAPKEEATA